MNDYLVRFGATKRWRLVRADNEQDAMGMVAYNFKTIATKAVPVTSPEHAIQVLHHYKADFEQVVLCCSNPSESYKKKAKEWLESQGKDSSGRGPITLNTNPVDSVALF